ncbi:MAG: hypothetical protein RIS79_623 [Verrucomicrobiota bacterium]
MCCDLDGFGTHSAFAQTLQLFTDAHDGLDGRFELATDIRERVFDRWRRAWLLVAIHDADLDEMTKALREHFRGDAGEIVLQLAEAAWTTAEIPDDVRRPGTAEEAHAKLQRTGSGRRCDSAFAARNHDG